MVLQVFLDNNPAYWCLVPMSCHQAKLDDDAYASFSGNINVAITTVAAAPQQLESPTFAAKPVFFAEVLGRNTRSREESIWLSKGVPKPPYGYRFSHRQIEGQIDFFKYKKESYVLPSNLVNLYNYTIVAVCKSSSF